MGYKFSNRSLNNLKGVHPKLVKLMYTVIASTPIDFVITEGVRSKTRQMEMFKAGKSKCDGVIKKSKHQIQADGYGHAIDLYPLPVQYKDMTPYKDLATYIKKVAKQLNISIVYGGDWTMRDYPHYQLNS